MPPSGVLTPTQQALEEFIPVVTSSVTPALPCHCGCHPPLRVPVHRGGRPST
jgi:hypothetical protein